MNRICLIDVSSILHTVKHSIGKKHKLSHNEKYTFIIYGFLFRLRAIAKNSLADQLVFCLDSDRSLRRALYFRQYKRHRIEQKKTPEQEHLDEISYPQFAIVKNQIIPQLGYKNIFHKAGFEADDIIASICQKYDEHEIVIVSSDEDMYQLLSRRTSIIKPKDYRWYNLANFKAEFGIEPEDWKKVKAYAGCKTDGVPGLPRIGEKTAIQYIKNTINPNTKAYQSFIGQEAKRIIHRNKILTNLPLKGTPEFILRKDDSLSKRALIEICREYNFKSILDDLHDFVLSLRLR